VTATVFSSGWRTGDGLSWLAWEGAGVAAAFPAREGGVSPAPYESLDLGLAVGDDPALVLENRRRFATQIGVALDRWVVPGQVHGSRLEAVGEPDAGRGAFTQDSVVPATDALTTAAPGLGLAVSCADCVPVVIAASCAAGVQLATVHAGWRGMIGGIVGQAAAALARRGRLVGAVIGPSIGPCCFTVDEALRRRFAARFPGSAGVRTVDLWECARQELEARGMPPGAISLAGLCTAHDGRFFSHRRDHGLTGRHLAIAWRLETEAGVPGRSDGGT
jgi:purine-nucleoside/S-methyl-5'-thioadenosine phosphorylase / adenosine deaminase